MEHIYDVIIVGGGPGGYAAALYSTRAGFDTLVLEKLAAGGQIALTSQVDNYPGFDDGIDGYLLGEKMKQGAERFGAKTIMTEVTRVELQGEIKEAETTDGLFRSKVLILATGASARELGTPGEKERMGRGVHYCATCDGMFYRGKTVVVVGGGNSAAAEALHLSRIAKKVHLVHRRDSLKATKIYHEPLMAAENVEFHWDSTVEEFLGEGHVTGVKLKNTKTGAITELAADGVFVSIGRKPNTELVKGQLPLDRGGYLQADETTKTAIPGVFAVGDVRTKEVRQVVTAAADGAISIHYAEEYLLGEG